MVIEQRGNGFRLKEVRFRLDAREKSFTMAWVGRDLYIPTSPNYPAMGSIATHRIRLLRSPSNQPLNTSRDGVTTASPGKISENQSRTCCLLMAKLQNRAVRCKVLFIGIPVNRELKIQILAEPEEMQCKRKYVMYMTWKS